MSSGGASSGDVIGTNFDIYGMDVFINGSTMTVQLIGPYFFNHGEASNDGDLYISSTGWKVSNTTGNSSGSKVPSASDTFIGDATDSNYEGWDYVVGVKQVLQYDSNQNRSILVPVLGVYKLDINAMPDVNKFRMTGGPRYDQAWKGGYGDFVESATRTPDYADSMLTYTFFWDPSFFPDPTNMGFHWTMWCGNDVVEGGGSTQVPEPGTMLLLGFALAGLGICSRRVAIKN